MARVVELRDGLKRRMLSTGPEGSRDRLRAHM